VVELYFIIEIVLSIFAISRTWEVAEFMNCGLLNPTEWGCFYELGGGDYIARVVVMAILGLVLDHAHHMRKPGQPAGNTSDEKLDKELDAVEDKIWPQDKR
jgi:hypothetical protein